MKELIGTEHHYKRSSFGGYMFMPGVVSLESHCNDLDSLFSFVCDFIGTNKIEALSKSRARDLVLTRQYFCWFARRYSTLSYDRIGEYLGRDHATVIHAMKAINNLIETDAKYRQLEWDLNKSVSREFKVKLIYS